MYAVMQPCGDSYYPPSIDSLHKTVEEAVKKMGKTEGDYESPYLWEYEWAEDGDLRRLRWSDDGKTWGEFGR